MKKIILFLVCCGLNFVFAGEKKSGYLYTAYGSVVKTVYKSCVHTSSFDSENGLAECGEASTKQSK